MMYYKEVMIMNKDKIIKDLKERNDKLANQRRQFEIRLINEQYLVEKKDKEIERLNKDLDTAIEICNNRQKEIVKLNNIINELEKYLEQQWLEWKDEYNFEVYSMAKEDKVILDKLKELKESERNFTKEELEAEENYYKRHQVPFKENYEDYYKGSDK